MSAKRFKLKIFLPSFQFCRSKLKSPTYFFSPINPKSFEISYPTFPDPPSTPNHSSSKIIPLNFQNIQDSPTSFENKNKSNKSISDSTVPITPPTSKNKNNSKSKPKVSATVSPGDSVWFSSEDEKETESLFSTSTSFDSSLETINESPGYENRININKNKSMKKKKKKKKSGNLRVQRLQRYVSNSWKTTSLESESDKVKESFAVVKKSEDPYGDFKRSMLEMILEKQMFEAKDLEELLQCFLSLNSRKHHAVIVQAFTEIWEDLFF